MKAAIYCRLSKEDDEHEKESESIQNQKSMLVNYALEHGLEIYAIYCDEDYSGVDRERPDFNRMLEAAQQHRFEIILAKTQSRFTRDMELVEKYLHGKFVEWGIRFIAVVDRVDTDDVANKKSRQINGLINEWYLEDLSNNVRSVLDHKRRAGKFVGNFAAYGYRKDPADKNHLLVDPEAAEIVKKIFSLYLAGKGVTKIAQTLNAEGVPTPTVYKHRQGMRYKQAARSPCGDVWSKATVHRILRARVYAGDLEQGRHKRVSYKSQKTVGVPRSQWIVVPDTHEPIIDKATFARVQAMMGHRARGNTATGSISPFANKVFCGLCGGAMEQTGGGKCKTYPHYKRYFRCRMMLRDKSRCMGQPYFPVGQMEELVLQRVQAYVAAFFEQGKLDERTLVSHNEKQRKVKEKEWRRLQGEIRRRTKALQDLYLDKSDGVIDAEQYGQLSRVYREEVRHLEARTVQLGQEIDALADDKAVRRLREQRLRECAEVKALTRELVELFIDKIFVYPLAPETDVRKIEIYWKF